MKRWLGKDINDEKEKTKALDRKVMGLIPATTCQKIKNDMGKILKKVQALRKLGSS